jgi:hypothetical protein
MVAKRFECSDPENNMLDLASFYSEDIYKPEEVSLSAQFISELAMDLNTDAVLPFILYC